MDRQKFWEREYESLMGTARRCICDGCTTGEAVVLKTAKGNIHTLWIPDFQDHISREALENRCIQRLTEENDTEVAVCLATMNGVHPEILSWNFRSGLIRANPGNLETECFLWGGGDTVYLKQFCRLMPPAK